MACSPPLAAHQPSAAAKNEQTSVLTLSSPPYTQLHWLYPWMLYLGAKVSKDKRPNNLHWERHEAGASRPKVLNARQSCGLGQPTVQAIGPTCHESR